MSDPALTSSWCTAWGSYNTPRLWAMVKNEDDPDAWRQVAAWGEISGAMKDQRSLLLQAREALVTAWPPEQNSSAAAFVGEVDKLIARMDAAKAEADDTATGLANILEALRQAKNNIEPLWEQYKQKSDDLVPAWWDNAEDELDKQAQAHMITAEQIVQDNVARLRVPDPYALNPTDPHYEPTPKRSDDGPGSGSGTAGAGGSVGGRAGGGTAVPVPHDPVPPLPGHEPTIADGLSAVDTGGSSPGDGGNGSGPGLAGVINPPVGSPPPGADVLPPGGGASGTGPPPGPVTGPGIGPVVGPGIGAGGIGPLGTGGSGGGGTGGLRGTGTGSPRGTGTGGLRGTGGSESGLRAPGAGGGGLGGVSPGGLGGVGRGARPGALPEAPGRRALPSGAVIGETVAGEGRGGAGGVGRGGASAGGFGQAGGTARGAAAGGAGRGRAGEPARPPRPSWLPDEPVGAARSAGTAAMPGTAGHARGGRRTGDGEQQPFDPDSPWEVAEGVDPVIAPGVDTARHDPGPNVIGRHG
jgi:hypothetical protein